MAEVTATTFRPRLAISRWSAMGLALLAIDLASWGILAFLAITGRSQALRVGYAAGALLVAAQLAALMCVPGIRTVARHTLMQCARMKIAVVFIVLLAVALAVISSHMRGDGTLAGQARTLLSYSTSATAMLLGILTIFVGASVISGDVQTKSIFITAAKPVARWQYVLGRWLGVVLLDAVLLGPTMCIIYGVSQYVRSEAQIDGQVVQPLDRLAVETEVFTSRGVVHPAPPNLEPDIEARLKELQADAQGFALSFNAYLDQAKGDTVAAREALLAEIRKQVIGKKESAPALPATVNGGDIDDVVENAPHLEWKFTGIDVGGQDIIGGGRIIDQPIPDDTPVGPSVLVPIQVEKRLMGKLVFGGPVRVGLRLDGRVAGLRDDVVLARFYVNDQSRGDLEALADGQEVRVCAEPTVQVTYRPSDVGEIFICRGIWVAENPTTGKRYAVPSDTPGKTTATMTFPARAVAPDGSMSLRFCTRIPESVTIHHEDVGVLYRTGSFEGNVIRCAFMMLLQLMFLAALSVFAGSFLSFPVACFVSFVFVAVAMAMGYLTEAVTTASGVLSAFARVLLSAVRTVLPDLQRTSVADTLAGGLAVPMHVLGETAFIQIAVRVLIVMVLACVIFQKRELARVQV